ncbi:MAG TPA: hypothetical protein VGL56_12880 [Fimbriimonadaceae bacterium]|jgi:hypothetical protein
MTPLNSNELFKALLDAQTIAQALTAIGQYEASNPETLSWTPFGRRNNRGTIEASGDPGRSLVERLTNGIDGVLELEHERHSGIPTCSNPKDAGVAWLGVPEQGLSGLTATQRRSLAQRVTVTLEEGDSRERRLVSVRDTGIGILPQDMSNTILSLSEDNKLQKHYLAGTFGQGGSSTLAACELCFIASRRGSDGPIGFTLVKYLDLDPELYKTGHYVWLGDSGGVLTAEPTDLFPSGTLCKHFGYDLDAYVSPLGPSSVYGLLNQVLFDPVMPVWLVNKVHGWNRVIKGSRNALNGALDDGDGRGPTLAHHMPMFYAGLGDFGRIGIEYWVLEAPTSTNKRPSSAFVNAYRPIILTSNGQNHAEFPQSLIRKDAELPFLVNRLICHINCDGLSAAAKRLLFVSNREEARAGAVRNLIIQELIEVLKSDTDLEQVNKDAKDHSRRERDESAAEKMRSEVSRLLRLQGFDFVRSGGEADSRGDTSRPPRSPRSPRPPLPLIEINEPPTYVKFAVDEDREISFFPGQRRYLRIDTDASSTYFNQDPERSQIQIMVANGNGLVIVGATPLKHGRMRVGLLCQDGTELDSRGNLRVELRRVGLPTLSDERSYSINAPPPARESDRRTTMPQFEIIPVEPQDENWITLNWPEDTSAVASSAEMSEGVLLIYYNTQFPAFQAKHFAFEVRDPSLAESFRSRYEIWLAMHSLLYYQDQQNLARPNEIVDDTTEQIQEMASENAEREERKRTAVLSVMIATKEATTALSEGELDPTI